ncbi:MAG TPA: glycosyltransferase [Casimicrobiaceae bacterium]|nr:glycosyltransferase [Casimicrobiaceae bacterium]
MRRWPDDAGTRPRERTRLLIVTDEMEVGGSQRQIVALSRGIDPAAFDVSVAYFRERSYLVDELEAAGVRVVHLPKRARVDPRFVAALAGEMRRGAHDIVHAFGFTAELWTAVARLALRGRDRPALVTSIRGTYDAYAAWQWRIKRWVSANSSRIVANSRAGAAHAAPRLRLPVAAIDVVYNGVADEVAPVGARAQLRQQWGVPDGAVVVLFVGRLVEVKRVDTLLHAAALLAADGCAQHVVICGDGPQRAALEQLARSLGVDGRVHFAGERSDVAAVIDAADLVVLPSRHEGLSNVILEAMRGARPVVASRAGGNVELVDHERNGLLFDVGDQRGLAAAIRRLAGDEPLRRAMGVRGAQRVAADFSVPRMVQALCAIYGLALQRPAEPGAATDAAAAPAASTR